MVQVAGEDPPQVETAKFAQVSGPVRVWQVQGVFDVPTRNHIRHEWEVNIPVKGLGWQIGQIVGLRGSRKTTVGRCLQRPLRRGRTQRQSAAITPRAYTRAGPGAAAGGSATPPSFSWATPSCTSRSTAGSSYASASSPRRANPNTYRAMAGRLLVAPGAWRQRRSVT
jgi:hypothetical protein